MGQHYKQNCYEGVINLRKFIVTIMLSLIVVGCSSKEEEVINSLKSEVEGKYSIVIFNNETLSEELQRSINNDLIDENGLDIPSLSYILVEENSSHKYDYKKVLSLEKFPEIFVFDEKGIVLRTFKVEELENFLLNQ
jgi:hypothetical protein